jgi:Transposase DDE domain/Domain of unknown function (DUF4372)
MGKPKHFTGQPIFNQLMLLIPRSVINKLIRKYNANRYCKKFKCHDHLVTMLFSTFHQCSSLRELTTGMQACYNRLRHLGLIHTPRRTTLADANCRRPVGFFEDLYHQVYRQYYGCLPDSLQGQNKLDRLFIIDATTVSLFSTVLAGAGSFGLNGKKKGGIKAHLLVRAKDNVPCFLRLTEAIDNDRKFLPYLHLPKSSIVVMDRGYNNYGQLRRWTDQKVTWITRPDARAVFKITSSKPVDQTAVSAGIIADHYIDLGNPVTVRLQPIQKVRLVVLFDQQKQITYQFITNDFKSSALTIAGLYKKRWQIETLFKRIKQNFNLNNFLGDSENAIRIQLWCTFIADLLIKIIKDQTAKKRNWSMANLTGLIRLHLFTYINLRYFLRYPDKALLAYEDPLHLQLQLFKT